MLSSPGLSMFPRSRTTFMCLSLRGASSLADDRAKDLGSATTCRCLLRVLTSLNGRWISRSRRPRKDRRQVAARNVPQRTLLAQIENLNHSEVVLKYGGQAQQTARECAGTVVRGHELCIVPHVLGGGAEPDHLQPRRDCCSFL